MDAVEKAKSHPVISSLKNKEFEKSRLGDVSLRLIMPVYSPFL